MWKLAIGAGVAMTVAIFLLYKSNGAKAAQLAASKIVITELEADIAGLTSTLEHKETELQANLEAMRKVQQQAAKYAQIREAILTGNTIELDRIEGPVGQALRLLAGLNLCEETEENVQ